MACDAGIFQRFAPKLPLFNFLLESGNGDVMNLHEYQAKQLLRDYGIVTPRGVVVTDAALIESAATALGGVGWVVKAQVHAGGRGKAGGVRHAQSIEELQAHAAQLLGASLVTHQNAPAGQKVRAVLVEESLDIQREIYLSLTVDRECERIVLVASAAGGMAIEEIAQTDPAKILREVCDPVWGLQNFQCRSLAFGLGLQREQVGRLTTLAKGLYRLFLDNDLSLLEINPLAVIGGELVALDCKIVVDDNALYRRQGLTELRDPSQDDPKEVAAREAGLNYIALDGNIGCMVNGAGLAMATMDLIKLHGGKPANFLDVGGGATALTVAHAFKIILADPSVSAVLVNIFGGIMRCDIIAEGIVEAVRDVGVTVPVVVRLEGTNVERGRTMLVESGLAIISADGLTDAAQQAVAAAR